MTNFPSIAIMFTFAHAANPLSNPPLVGSPYGIRPRTIADSSTSTAAEPSFPYGEDLLQFIWASQLFDQQALRTTDGRSIQVLRPGHIQHNSGPDLLDAQVRIDGQLWAGTVEVHARSSEWNLHGHQLDPAYENVVLHVVYTHDAEVRTLGGTQLPTLELMPRLSTESLAMYRKLMLGQGFVPCADQIAHVEPVYVGAWLERMLIERLERKTLEVQALLEQLRCDAAETLYHMIARALGMKVNADPFGMLAHAVPLRTLLKYRDDALRTEALLFGQAGLLQVDLFDDYPQQLQHEHALLARLHGLLPTPVAAWKFARMRPTNFPTIRIAQLAQLIMRCGSGLSTLLHCDQVADLYPLLDVTASSYWNDHYTFDTPSTPRMKRLGRTGAQHLIINALVPTLFALGRAHGRAEASERALHLLEQLPAEKNSVLKAWSAIGIRANSAARGQALLELKNRYCTSRRCLSCGVGNQLLKPRVCSTNQDHRS